MEYDIQLSQWSIAALADLRKYDQVQIREALVEQLAHQPGQETGNRKRLRPNDLAEWELRVGKFRVFYDVKKEAALFRVVAIGLKKGNKLKILGQEYEL